MALKPWAIGPFELLQHAEGHHLGQRDFDRRMALISFDNAIESSVTTYLSLDPSQRSGRQYQRDEVAKWLANFHSKLTFLEKYASSIGASMKQDRAAMVFYHQLRNELYHDGNGFVPSSWHLDGIREAALWTFSVLFECDAEALLTREDVFRPSRDADVKLSEATAFLQSFLSARQALADLASLQSVAINPSRPLMESLKHVAASEGDSSLTEFADDLKRAEKVTDALVDNACSDGGKGDIPELTRKLELLSAKLDERLRAHQREIVVAAIRETLRASSGNRRAGVVCQVLGSGRLVSLVAYISTLCEEASLPFRQYFVIFDRAILVDQFVHAYNGRPEGGGSSAKVARRKDWAVALESSGYPVVTTVQTALSHAKPYEKECLVVYDGDVTPPDRLFDSFPLGTFIRFTSTPEAKASNGGLLFGDSIYMYGHQQARQDGVFLPVSIVAARGFSAIDRDAVNASSLESLPGDEWIAKLAQAIVADHRFLSDGKAIILCKDTELVQQIAAHINLTLDEQGSDGGSIPLAAAVGSFMHAFDVQKIVNDFQGGGRHPTFLVMTPASLVGMDIAAAQTCYVTCNVRQLTQVNIVSKVSRRFSNKERGRVVDYQGHSWDMI